MARSDIAPELLPGGSAKLAEVEARVRQTLADAGRLADAAKARDAGASHQRKGPTMSEPSSGGGKGDHRHVDLHASGRQHRHRRRRGFRLQRSARTPRRGRQRGAAGAGAGDLFRQPSRLRRRRCRPAPEQRGNAGSDRRSLALTDYPVGVIPGRGLQPASPESISPGCGFGFRAPSRSLSSGRPKAGPVGSGPGMTVGGSIAPGLRSRMSVTATAFAHRPLPRYPCREVDA